MIRYVELFAGGGGLSLGLDRAGWECVAHAEIERHARAVLRAHWPNTLLLGDVVALTAGRRMGDWVRRTLVGVDAVTGGSPCQDLSVAGKRAGLGGARSTLFHRQVRLWKMLGAPYCLWENVPGAFSSQKGADFAAVLSTLVGAAIAVPRDGWQWAGVAVGPTAVAAWRVFDLQHFGPPQRRARVFVLAARAGGSDPAEILALSEGMCGHPAPLDPARQNAAADAGSGAPRGRGTLAHTVAGTLGTMTGGFRSTDLDGIGAYPVAFAENQRGELRTSEIAPQLTTGGGKPGEGYSAVLQPTLNPAGRMAAIGFNWQNGGGYGNANDGLGITHDGTGPLSRKQVMAVVGVDLAPTLGARDFKGPGNFQDGALQATVFPAGRPRRLLPVECERLMGWPDGWTQFGIDDKSERYALSDTARYRIIGNGVGSPLTEWIGRRLAGAL